MVALRQIYETVKLLFRAVRVSISSVVRSCPYLYRFRMANGGDFQLRYRPNYCCCCCCYCTFFDVRDLIESFATLRTYDDKIIYHYFNLVHLENASKGIQQVMDRHSIQTVFLLRNKQVDASV